MKSLQLLANLEEQIIDLSFQTVGIAGSSLLVLLIVAALLKDHIPKLKAPLFGVIALTVSVATIILIGGTVYLNTVSYTKGPVHWHADVEIWACNNELELRNPTGRLSNKIGTPTLHEHNDQRVHLEGVPIEEYDASLQKFFDVIGGQLDNRALQVPLNADGPYYEDDTDADGESNPTNEVAKYIIDDKDAVYAQFLNGQTCANEISKVQVFRYRTTGENTYVQTKMDITEDIVIAGESQVPNGDCYIVEFGPNKDFTDRLCAQYGVRDTERCEAFGVKPDEKDICTFNDVTEYPQDTESTDINEAPAPGSTEISEPIGPPTGEEL